MATGLKIWLKSWTLWLIGRLLKGIQSALCWYAIGDASLVPVSALAFKASMNTRHPEPRKALEKVAGNLAAKKTLQSGFKGTPWFKLPRVALTLAGTNSYIPLKPNYYEKISFIDGRPDDSGHIECKC